MLCGQVVGAATQTDVVRVVYGDEGWIWGRGANCPAIDMERRLGLIAGITGTSSRWVQLSLAALLDMLCIILRRLGEDRQGHGASADGPGNGPDEMARLSAVGGPERGCWSPARYPRIRKARADASESGTRYP